MGNNLSDNECRDMTASAEAPHGVAPMLRVAPPCEKVVVAVALASS